VKNTLAYYIIVTIDGVKGFVVCGQEEETNLISCKKILVGVLKIRLTFNEASLVCIWH